MWTLKPKNKMNYQKKAIDKTVQLLNLSINECQKGIFNPRKIARDLNTCNATFYDAVSLGMFTKLDRGIYKPNKEYFTVKDAKQISDYRRGKQYESHSKKTPAIKVEPLMLFDKHNAEYHINALKEMGYTGVIEKKQVINF